MHILVASDESSTGWRAFWLRAWPLVIGVVAVLSVTAVRFSTTVWQQNEYEHGPLLMLMALAALYWHRAELLESTEPKGQAIPGLLLALGATLFVVGARIDLGVMEAEGAVPILAGALWAVGGRRLVAKMWLPILFLVIAAPIPPLVLGAVTDLLKQGVSAVAESVLAMLGYPVARGGVVITVGQYQLLVADACSGMNSIFSLGAVGLLYLDLFPPASRIDALILALCIVPFAILANTVRVMLLILITYHFGDAAGQGFIHSTAGLVMFVVALGALALLGHLLAARHETSNGMSAHG
jgi:exosortase